MQGVWEQAEGSPHKALLSFMEYQVCWNQCCSQVCWSLLSCLMVFCACAFTEDKEETVAKMYISELKNIRLRLEDCEQRLIKRIQSPASSRTDRDARQDSALRIAEQEVSPKSNGCWIQSKQFQNELKGKRVWILRNKATDSWQSYSRILPWSL